MRFLFSFAGGTGHVQPMLPLAACLAARGHVVRIAGHLDEQAWLTAAGFDAVAIAGRPDTPAPVMKPLREPSQRHEDEVIAEHFVTRIGTARAPAYLAVIESFAPDVIVRDETDFAMAWVAESLGLPRAVVVVLGAGLTVTPAVAGATWGGLRAAAGLGVDPELRAFWQELVLSPFPPSFRSPLAPLPAASLAYRPSVPAAWRPDGTVYVTLGSEFGLESGDLFHRLLEGLSRLGNPVVLTVGRYVDPASLGTWPAHVTVEAWLPMDELLPRCSLVVSHGGSGTMAACMLLGVPQVVVPMGADQLHNAARCVELGLGLTLSVWATPAEIHAAAKGVLASPSVASACARVREEYAGLPPVEVAAERLESLARRPSTQR